MYLTALLACLFLPNLPSLSKMGFDILDTLFKLERLGVLVHKHFDDGEQPCFQMHALVAHTLQSKILDRPFDHCLTHFLRCFRMLCRCLAGEEYLDAVSQDKVIFSAMCLESTLKSLIEQLCEKNTTSVSGPLALRLYIIFHLPVSTVCLAWCCSAHPDITVPTCT